MIASTVLRRKLAIFDLRTSEGSHGVTWILSDMRKMAEKRQDGLLALSEICNPHCVFLFQKESRSTTGKSQQFCYNIHIKGCVGHGPYTAANGPTSIPGATLMHCEQTLLLQSG